MKGILTLEGRQVAYELTYKKVKYVNIRVRADGTVAVSANRWVPQTQVEAILTQRADFILNALKKYAALEQVSPKQPRYHSGDTLWLLGKPYTLAVEEGLRNQVQMETERILLTVKDREDDALRAKTMETFYRDQCLEVTTRLIGQIQPVLQPLGVPLPEVRVRSMTSRWGSCKPTAGRVTFARQLIEAPLPCVEYVVWHELVHFIHPNHSADFYRVLAAFLPHWKDRRELLNSHSYRHTP